MIFMGKNRIHHFAVKQLELADILRPSLDDAMHLTGLADPDRIVDYYLGLGPKIVALTLGTRGALFAAAGDLLVVSADDEELVPEIWGDRELPRDREYESVRPG